MKVWKQIICLIECLFLCNIIALPITAAPKTSGVDKQGIEWSYDKKTKTLTFEGKGKTAEYYNEVRGVQESTPWWEWHEECKKVVFSDDITEIGAYYLSDFWELQKVKLPKELRKIENGVFEDCKSLKNIKFPEKLEVIGDSAFCSCMLKEVALPKTIKRIGDYAFCSNDLEEVEWLSSISYGSCVYSGNENLSKMIFSQGMKELPIGYMMEIYQMKKAVFPKMVTKIPQSAFSYSDIQEIELPSSVKKVGKWAFLEAKIRRLELNEGLEYIGDEAFSGTQIDEIVIPETVTHFGKNVFVFCEAKKIVLPQNIKKIKANMFADCTKLESIVIPKEVTEIDINAFQHCRMLKTMTLESEKITKIDKDVFGEDHVFYNNITIYVPKNCYESYKRMFGKVVMPREYRILPIEEKESQPVENAEREKSSFAGKIWIVVGILVVVLFGVFAVRKIRKRK